MRRVKLIPDKEYLFTHKRIRTFRAVFKQIVRAPSTDSLDEYYYQCEVDSSLSGNPWSKMQGEARALICIRPSLITVIQDAPRDPGPSYHFRQRIQNQSQQERSEGWVRECMHSIRSVLRNLKRSRYDRGR